jgi:guanine deaminase
MSSLHGIRGAFLDFIDDPFQVEERESIRYIPDGLLVSERGQIQQFGSYAALRAQYAGLAIAHYPDQLILPGLIDAHVHYPQTEMIASYGEQLLEWLERYTFPTERKFADKAYAQHIASLFLDQLLRNGTTTALVFATVHPQSVDAFFEEAARRNARMVAGKVLMDRNAPEFLRDTPERAYAESKDLIQRWHGRGRSLYAVTPRFAATSTPEQLAVAGQLLREFPEVYLHTHLSENLKEVAWTKELFPESRDYLAVYDRFGLVTERSIFAHGIHLSEAEFERLAAAGAAIAFCPSSNLFLGSGLFKLSAAKAARVPVGLGTDVGAGTSFSLLHTANQAYKVMQLQGQPLSALRSLFLATLGGARSLSLQDKIGSFNVGNEADFIVVDLRSTPLLALRNQGEATTLAELAEQLFGLLMLGDDRAIHATYVAGEKVMF